jgi:hypothetical protein
MPTPPDDSTDARCGWLSDFPTFYDAKPRVVRGRLEQFIRDAGHEQLAAWDQAIPLLQRECREIVQSYDAARTYTAILEYELPRESRRPDVVVLENGVVAVLELKGKSSVSQADIDQAHAYARDLKAYHRECADRPVHAVLVPTRADGNPRIVDQVHIVGPEGLDRLLLEFSRATKASHLSPDAFLHHDAYQPLPTLVRAARDLFSRQPLPTIKRARAATDPAVDCITAIAHQAASTSTRRLVLLTGIPGSGKTLVGLRIVHAGFLDDLAVPRAGGRPTSPAVFLSGNGPLVQVLQDALKAAGGGGKVFVRDVKNYVKHYSGRRQAVPPEHLLIFDEAQRAWDAGHVRRKQPALGANARSEPEHFIEFAERIPGWCVVVGLVGGGQEIHAGEEGGLVQWRKAIEEATLPESWTVHAPPALNAIFAGSRVNTRWEEALNLDQEIRYHLAPRLSEFVEQLLGNTPSPKTVELAAELQDGGHSQYVTRDLTIAERYARDRYTGAPQMRYGLLASSKDKLLPRYGVDNTYQTTKRLRVGRWYNAPQDDPESCCSLTTVATEFSAQGLELDLTILAWGSDFARRDGEWSIERSGKTKFAIDPFRLRQNVYRVLLTRGRDGTVVFVLPDPWLDETYHFLLQSGFRTLQ